MRFNRLTAQIEPMPDVARRGTCGHDGRGQQLVAAMAAADSSEQTPLKRATPLGLKSAQHGQRQVM